jgi:AmmeMemoRadiSam system protein B/AmmeMemoRadiSam system protein A
MEPGKKAKPLRNRWFSSENTSTFQLKHLIAKLFWANFRGLIIAEVMRLTLIVFLSIFFAMESFPQAKTTDRQPYAAGRFYPSDKETLSRDISALFRDCAKPRETGNVRAIISPHAGYIFSGSTAAAAFSSVPANHEYKNIFIIGSSHIMSFDGASVYSIGDFVTPLGKVTVNRTIAEKLIRENKVFDFPVTSHIQEHSLEVQIPFIQYHFRKTPPIVPIIIGTNNQETIRKIAQALRPYFTPENLFVISSDFSHYPPYREAVETDRATALSIVSGNPDNFLSTLQKNAQRRIKGLATSMCGWTSGLTLLFLTENNDQLEYNLLDYSNSGDSQYGGKDEVVGYNAISVTEKYNGQQQVKKDQEFSFTNDEKEQLFTLARNSIKSRLDGDKRPVFPDQLSPKLHEPMGVFVTLKIKGSLRGCIGRFISPEPLYEVVQQSALSSAFEDPRFQPVTKDEFDKLEFEITVLGPLKKINDINEIVLGRHGIYIKKDMRSGTMLPQVATENKWTVEEFLGYTSRDKAGLGWDGWRNADLYIYEGLVLEENHK